MSFNERIRELGDSGLEEMGIMMRKLRDGM